MRVRKFKLSLYNTYFIFAAKIIRYYTKADIYTTGHGLDGWGSIPGRSKMFFFSTESRAAMWPTQLPIQRVPEAISSG
jgi:hypothetical protein